MERKRLFRRYKRRLPIRFGPDGPVHRGISTSVSERGFFIRSRRVYRKGVRLVMEMTLPDGIRCELHGVVRYARRLIVLRRRNGMGVEILQNHPDYIAFMRSLQVEEARPVSRKTRVP